MVDKWIDSTNVAWERISKQTNKNELVDFARANGLGKENRYELGEFLAVKNASPLIDEIHF